MGGQRTHRIIQFCYSAWNKNVFVVPVDTLIFVIYPVDTMIVVFYLGDTMIVSAIGCRDVTESGAGQSLLTKFKQYSK